MTYPDCGSDRLTMFQGYEACRDCDWWDGAAHESTCPACSGAGHQKWKGWGLPRPCDHCNGTGLTDVTAIVLTLQGDAPCA